ncbi:MAG: hypothetical protein IKB82_02140 [Clostridia bacterium]|nr:hypothetical protein [Clostridia bacterium]
MAGLDMQYIAELVAQAQEGDINAFAELFAATCQNQYAFARQLLGDDFLAQQALQSAYTEAIKKLYVLRDPMLVEVWLSRIVLKSCFNLQAEEMGKQRTLENHTLKIRGAVYSARQVMTLPLGESQALLLRHLCGMKTGPIASLLEMKRAEVRRCMRNGVRRLAALSAEMGGEQG